jgi:salicylate hydroxylase
MAEDKVLIAGGGIGGFAAALALSRRGQPVHLLEQASEFVEIGAGIQLGPNVFAMFEALGLTAAIEETVVYPDGLEMRDALSGEVVTHIPVNTEAFRARFTLPYGVIYRPDLHNALIDACKASPLIELTTEAAVTGFEAHGETVSVSTERGETFTGAALIGADGLWSKIRAGLFGDEAPRVSGHIAYRAVLPAADMPEHLRWNRVVLWAGPRTHLVQYPLHRGEIFNLVAVFHSDRYEEGWDVYGEPAELQRRFAGEHAHVLELLEKIESWRMWVLCDREPIREWSRGRVTLLGDAAHPMLQYLAQGACMAIEDAVCLADKWAAFDGDPARAFPAYQSARYLRTGRVQLTARFYGDVYHAEGVTRELRNMTLAGRAPEGAYEGMAWLYAGVAANGDQVL